MYLPKTTFIQITGDISIEPVAGRIPTLSYINLYSIMGPTGAGKSSFIEALAGDSQRLSISKDQLAGYTQTVNAYQVVNVVCHGSLLYLVDTPGFSDSKISEVEIIDMIRRWMKDNNLGFFDRMLYLTPISETRLPGSRRRTMEMLKRLLEPTYAHGSVSFVTTMWDTVHNERTRMRAESNFAQLRDQVCKNFFGELNGSITQFMNTRSSALEILDDIYAHPVDSFSKPISSAAPHLYHDLHERVKGALQANEIIESDLAQPEAQTNSELQVILKKNQRENHETLSKFIAQLVDFGPPPPGLQHAAQRLRKSIAATTTPPNFKYKWLFTQWEHEAEIPADHDSNNWMGTLVSKGLT